MQFIIHNIVGFLCFNLYLISLDPPFCVPQFRQGKTPLLLSVWSSLSSLELCFSVVFFIFTWVTSAPEEEWIGWILLTCCCPALLMWTFVGWGWQGITNQLLSDKLNWGDHKQDGKKEPLGHMAPLLWTCCLCEGLLGTQGQSRTLFWTKLSMTC